MLIWEQLARQHQTQVLAATLAASMGAQVEIPDEFEMRAQFDEMLRSPLNNQNADPDQLVLMRALGMR